MDNDLNLSLPDLAIKPMSWYAQARMLISVSHLPVCSGITVLLTHFLDGSRSIASCQPDFGQVVVANLSG